MPGDLVTLGASDSGRGRRERRVCPRRDAREGSSRWDEGTHHGSQEAQNKTNLTANTVHITITPNDKGNPPGKLADVEVHFRRDSLVEGLKLFGVSIWERRGGSGRNVTFPTRQYAVNGERRSVALLPPIVHTAAQHALRDVILDGYAEFEQSATAEA